MSLAKFKASIAATDGEGRMFSLDEAKQAIAEVEALEAELARLRAKLSLTPENVEKAARALCRNDCESDPDEPLGRIEGDPRKYVWELYADDATAAIKALGADQ